MTTIVTGIASPSEMKGKRNLHARARALDARNLCEQVAQDGALPTDVGHQHLRNIGAEPPAAKHANRHRRVALQHGAQNPRHMVRLQANQVGVEEDDDIGVGGGRACEHRAALAPIHGQGNHAQ
jgi:hypothetical protein